ncbi:hypothetical protein ACOMHN_017797 [Nucella lapillus]
MRQARQLKARSAKEDDDEFGDVTREFQDLVRRAVARRRSTQGSRTDMDRSYSPDPWSELLNSPRMEDKLRVSSPNRRRSSIHRLLSPSPSRRTSGGSDVMLSLRSPDVVRRSVAKSRAGSFTGSVDLE